MGATDCRKDKIEHVDSSPTDILPSEITPGTPFHRREWLKQAASMGLLAGLPVLAVRRAGAGLHRRREGINPAYAPADEKINRLKNPQYCNATRILAPTN